ncbi:MAG: hypothetical protein CVT65_08915 [Actinobacteria bacterium HGW-Actinobacteria-5]|jgi:hypothetical protein|nr:MAG: hypothetical protein CVT65_08915 [Actinobacteria bacterium HGW-Actinobacteria-5]
MAQQPSRDSRRTALREAARREEQRQRRRTLLIWGLVGLSVVVIASITVVLSRPGVQAAAPSSAITYPGLSRGHVSGTVSYAQTPPAGGDHAEVWQNCGIYTDPVPNEAAVHSLEHGAIWITYQPDLPTDQVMALQDAVRNQPYGLLSPYPADPSPVVATVWGVQLRLDSATDPRLSAFIAEYADATKAPEPQGECTGGVGNPQG